MPANVKVGVRWAYMYISIYVYRRILYMCIYLYIRWVYIYIDESCMYVYVYVYIYIYIYIRWAYIYAYIQTNLVYIYIYIYQTGIYARFRRIFRKFPAEDSSKQRGQHLSGARTGGECVSRQSGDPLNLSVRYCCDSNFIIFTLSNFRFKMYLVTDDGYLYTRKL